jgi:hypothetical protein
LKTWFHARLLATLNLVANQSEHCVFSSFNLNEYKRLSSAMCWHLCEYIRTPDEKEREKQQKKKGGTQKPIYGLDPNRTGVVCMVNAGQQLAMKCRRGPPATKPYPPF